MKVGTDAVLLGAWVKAESSTRILDIGTGTGILAIMLAQKTNAIIDAIDIDGSAIEQARENVELCEWKNRIHVTHSSFQNFVRDCNHQYDLIVSNPPFFIDSYKSPKQGRTMARHNDSLPFADLIDGVIQLLHPNGSFNVILPKNEGSLFLEMAKKKGLGLTNLLKVKTKHENSTEKRQLLRFEFNSSEHFEKTISIEKEGRHNYHEDYINLTKDFYLNF